MTESRATTLAHWGNTLRAARQARHRLCRRAIAIGALGIALGATIALPPRPALVWNASASAPTGLYSVRSATALSTGDMVVARVPEPMRQFAARRHYLPANVPLVKRIAGEPGDTICALGRAIFVNGRRVAERRLTDGAGRAMPSWTGCMTLRRGAMFLLMADSAASFDGRYFGATSRRDIIGKAIPLWVR